MEDRFALLIDADNVSAKYIKPILDELSKYGNVTYKRIYGDWTKTNNASWKEELLQNSITPIQQFSYTHGKNATDSAMIIDAMDMLYTSELEGFCLVSSDSDFTKLASRLRESGKTVIGMGEGKTPSPFRKACDIFTELELLLEDNTMGKEERNTHSHASGKWQKKDNHDSMVSKEKIEEAVVKIITENQNNDRETGLGEVGSRLVKLYPDFDVRRYGYSLLSKFLETLPRLMLIQEGTKVSVALNEDKSRKEMVEEYIQMAANKSSVDRLQGKEKTGVFTGSYAINPLNGAKVPIWLSDYVLADYGTGAIMCVPAHDDRDFEFAKKFDIPIIQVIAKDGKEIENMTEAYTEAVGTMINSGEWNGMESSVLKKEAPHIIEEKGFGRATVNYKLRDWVFSRQRYWGEPIPIIHCPDCGPVPVPEDQLPLLLPDVESYEPTGTGESPLAAIDEWVNTTCPCCGKPAKRETNTMPQWAGSSWYFLRYVDNKNDKELVSKQKAHDNLPVDMYIGGVEHAVLHLLYSRFYTKFLYDIGVVDFEEPFKKLFNQGMITGKNGIKMSKSKGNVVSPDDLVRDYGCDSLRLYEMFVGPPELDSEWDERGIDGVYRFITKFWKLATDSIEKDVKATKEMIKIRHQMVHTITKRLEDFSLNTVVSGFMEYNNKLNEIAKREGGVDKETIQTFTTLIAPFAPHIAEELWEKLGNTGSVFENNSWPEADQELMKDDEIKIPVQINGKTKEVIEVPADISKEDAIAAGKEAIADKINGNIVKEIYVPGRIINLVVK